MTTHLTPEELVDLVEGQLDPVRADHVNTCERCRDKAAGLRSVVSDTRGLDVPEPSPLFWSHQADRIRAAVESDGPTRGAWWRWPRLGGLSAAAVSVVLVLVVIGLSTGDRRPSPQVRDGLDPGAPEGPHVEDIEPVRGGGAAWTLLLTVAEGVDWETPDGGSWTVEPEAIDGAVSELSSRELGDLGRLLEAEIEGSSL